MGSVSHVVDTGPLVALLDASDRDHAWARGTLGALQPPLITCEAVLSEALFLLQGDSNSPGKFKTLLDRGVLICVPVLHEHGSQVLDLMARYQDVPMSLADGCLVRLAETLRDSVVVTLDSDFSIYRKYRRQRIPLLSPR